MIDYGFDEQFSGITKAIKGDAMKTSSCKSKGRRLQQWVAQKISDLIELPWGPDEQVASREMGQSGPDIRLIGDARHLFPWSVEAKNQERI